MALVFTSPVAPWASFLTAPADRWAWRLTRLVADLASSVTDPVASVVRPVRWLAGWARVALEPGQAARVEFAVHADRTSFTGRDLRRIVEPGEIVVGVGRSSADLPLRGSTTLEGPVRELGTDRVLTVPVEITAC